MKKERSHALEKMWSVYLYVDSLDKRQMFVFLMGPSDAEIQKWLQ